MEMPDGAAACSFCGMNSVDNGNRPGQYTDRFQGPYGGNIQTAAEEDRQFTGMPAYGQPVSETQPQSSGQYGADTWYGQPSQPMMGYTGYENRATEPAKKKQVYIPNLINIVGIIMAALSVFLPYAHMNGDVRSISSVFGITVIGVAVCAVAILADVICAFIRHTACFIVDLIISIPVGTLLLIELVLAIIEKGRLDASVDAGLEIGAWLSLAAAMFLIVSVPIWWPVMGRRKKD